MAITRTAKGTAKSKASNTTLQLSSVSLNAGDLLIVGIGYETDFSLDTIKWGSRELKLVPGSTDSQGDTTVKLYRAKVRDTATRDIVATWSGNMSARAMFATALTEVSTKDVGSTNSFAAGTTAPNTGIAVTSTAANTFSIAAFVSGGPSTDTAGTAGDSHTLGQRDGTTGGGAATNVTIQESYEVLTSIGDIRASMSGTTGRVWACAIAAFRCSQAFTVKELVQHHRDMNGEPDWVRVKLEDESGASYWALIDPEDFDEMSDAEVIDTLTASAIFRANRSIENDSNVTIDSARDSRMATFVNDTIIV